VITNERQYRITRNWLARFEQARAAADEQEAGGALHPRARQALRDQYDSQIEELREQLAEYEAPRLGSTYGSRCGRSAPERRAQARRPSRFSSS
jgi:hypothetical protein